MKLPSDPTEIKSEHCKIYVEPSVKKAISEFQTRHSLDSFSTAGRELILIGLGAIVK